MLDGTCNTDFDEVSANKLIRVDVRTCPTHGDVAQKVKNVSLGARLTSLDIVIVILTYSLLLLNTLVDSLVICS